jgi:hypothetical protein
VLTVGRSQTDDLAGSCEEGYLPAPAGDSGIVPPFRSRFSAMRRTLLFLCGVVTLFTAAPAFAQIRLQGIVRDDMTGAALPEARVELLDGWGMLRRSRMTDSLGHFEFPLKRLGVYRVRVRRRGYAESMGTLLTEAYVYLNVEFRVRPGLPLMAPLTLLARAQKLPSPVMEGFHTRLRQGRGRYFTREDVESVRPGYVSDMLTTIPGFLVRRTGTNGADRTLFQQRVTAAGVRQADCALRVFVDGDMLNPRLPNGEPGPAGFDATVEQTMVEGIELYLDPAKVPAELGGPGPCGAVAVWTRRSA